MKHRRQRASWKLYLKLSDHTPTSGRLTDGTYIHPIRTFASGGITAGYLHIMPGEIFPSLVAPFLQ